jgi:hypothetical protein
MGDSVEVRASLGDMLNKYKVYDVADMMCLACGEMIPVGMFVYDLKTKKFTEEKEITLAAFYYTALGHEIERHGGG